MNYNELFDELAKAGFETMHEDKWDEATVGPLERDLWRVIAMAIVSRLWEVFNKETEMLKWVDKTGIPVHDLTSPKTRKFNHKGVEG